jgi:hypothetical protein
MSRGPRATAAATAGALGALLLTAPSPRVALGSLAGAGSATDPTAPLVAAVALLAWAVAGWLALTVVVVLLSRVPGLLGRTARALAGRVAPATVRRAVEAALGITVAVGVVAPPAALASPATLPTATLPTAVAAAEAAWDLDWPSRTATPTSSPPAPAAPGPAAPTPRPAPAVTATRPPPPAEPPRARPAPVTAPPPVVRHSPVAPAAGAVVVRPGDTLWSLAEASLRGAGTAPTDRQVAQAWPRWWAANREAVGGDPDLLLPGTVLRPPGSS